MLLSKHLNLQLPLAATACCLCKHRPEREHLALCIHPHPDQGPRLHFDMRSVRLLGYGFANDIAILRHARLGRGTSGCDSDKDSSCATYCRNDTATAHGYGHESTPCTSNYLQFFPEDTKIVDFVVENILPGDKPAYQDFPFMHRATQADAVSYVKMVRTSRVFHFIDSSWCFSVPCRRIY